LRKVLDWLPKARQLLTVKRDVPLPVKIDELVAKPDPAKQRSQYERYGFKTWLKDLEGAPASASTNEPAPAPAAVQKRQYRTILTEDELKGVLLKIEAVDLVGIDAVATSEDPLAARLIGLAFAFGDEAAYLPLAHDYAGAPAQLPIDVALGLLKPWLERADCRKVGEK
jgi:DNA polymerase-1